MLLAFDSATASNAVNHKVFAASGSFTVPDGVYLVYVSMIDAGISAQGAAGGNRENSGLFILKRPVSVTPGQVIPIVIGAHGFNAYYVDTTLHPATPSGRTTFGALTTDGGNVFPGAQGSTGQLYHPGFYCWGMGAISGFVQATDGCCIIEW